MGVFTGTVYDEAVDGDIGSTGGLDGILFGLDTTINGTTSLAGSSFDFDFAVLDNKIFNGADANPRAPGEGDTVYFTLTASGVSQLSFNINNYSRADPVIFQKDVSDGGGGSFTFSGSYLAGGTPDYFGVLGSSFDGGPLPYTLKLSSRPTADYDLGLLASGIVEVPDSKLGPHAEKTYAFHIDRPMTLFGHTEGNAKLQADLANIQPTLWPGESYGPSLDFSGELEDNLMPGDYVLTYSSDNKALSELLSLRLVSDSAGNDAFWARDLGVLVDGVTRDSRSDHPFVSRVDGIDFYRFTLTEPSAVAITLQTENSMFANGVRLYLDDADSLAGGAPTSGIPTGFQDILAPAAQQYIDMTTTAARGDPLPAGSYFFHVEGPTSRNFDRGDVNENYNVFVTAWADGAGNAPENAHILSVGTDISVNDRVNLADPNDYYHISVTSRGVLHLDLDFAGDQNADLQLLRFSPVDQAMTVTDFGLGNGNSRAIGPAQVDPGDYYIRIFTDTTYAVIDTPGYDHGLSYPDDGGAQYTLSLSFDPLSATETANLTGGTGNDTIAGGKDNDTLIGDAGNDALYGGAGFDTLIGGAGNDILDGGTNPDNQGDIMLGGAGDDTYYVDSTLDLVDEGFVFPDAGWGGTDTIVSTANWYWDSQSVGEIVRIAENASDPTGAGVTFVGGIFDNVLYGHSGTDILFGRGGNDIYRAGDGVDWISLSTLGVNDDNAYKGVDGHNTVIVDPRSTGKFSYDIIFEFDPARDKVDVSAYGSQYASGADVLSHAVDDGAGSSYIALGDGLDYLYFVGLSKADLLAGDFIV